MIRTVMTLAAACFALGCSTAPNAKDIELTNAGVLFGIEACEMNAITGISLGEALRVQANGRSYEVYNSAIPRSGIVPPSWKLDGLVWVGINQQGTCDVISMSGSGTASRDAVMARQIGSPIRKWSRMRVIDPQPGDARDAVCSTERVVNGSAIIVMTTDLSPGIMDRKFVATVMRAKAEECTSKMIQ